MCRSGPCFGPRGWLVCPGGLGLVVVCCAVSGPRLCEFTLARGVGRGSCFPKGVVSGRSGWSQVVTSGRRRAWAFVGVRSVRKRGPTASQVGSGPRESRVLELGKLVCRPPGRRRRCPTQGAPRTPRVHLPSPRAPPSAMPRNAHVPPRRRCDVVEIRRAQDQAVKDGGRQNQRSMRGAAPCTAPK